MAKKLVASWKKWLDKQAEDVHPLTDFFLAECPRRAAHLKHTQVSEAGLPGRLSNKAQWAFKRRIAGRSEKAIPMFKAEFEDTDGWETILMGSMGVQNVCLLLAPVGIDPLDHVHSWSVRWEMAALATLTGNNRFFLIVAGTGTQIGVTHVGGTIEARTDSAELLLDPPGVACSACTGCEVADLCPVESRLSEHPLGKPPKFKLDPIRKVGLLRQQIDPLKMLFRELKKRDKRSTGYHPSTIGKELEEDGGPCMRILYYEATGVESDESKNWLYFVFEFGHAWHEVIQDMALAVDPTVEIEKKVRAGRLVGHLDLRTKTMIADIKTASSTGTRKGHIGQVHCYSWAEEQAGNPVEKLSILTILKGEGTIGAKEFRVDPKMYATIEKTIFEADKFVDSGEVPPRYEGAEAKSWRCRDCNFTSTCWEPK